MHRAAYSWLDDANSGYIHHVHNHGHGDFGIGFDSTSHIEQIWGRLKNLIKNIYYSIPHDHFVLYIREAEFRRAFKMLPKEKRVAEIYTVFNYIGNLNLSKLYTEKELYELTNKF